MKNINDEILNDYLDGNLGKSQMIEVKMAIDNDHLLKARYNALLTAHRLLKEVKTEKVSDGFEKRVMSRINRRREIAKQQKRFMMIIFSLFAVLLLGIVGYTFTEVMSSIKSSESENLINSFTIFLNDYQKLLFNKTNLTILGSILSFIMIISGYSLFEFQKRSKKLIS